MKNNSFLRYATSHPYLKYVVSAFLLVAVTAIKLAFFDSLGARTPFMLYFAVIIFVAVYFGDKVAWFSTGLAVLLIDYFFMPPFFSFSFSLSFILQIIVFLIECGFVVWLSKGLEAVYKRVSESQKLFQILIEKSSDGIMMIGLDGKIIYCSPSVKDLTGYTEADIVNSDFWGLLITEEITDVKEKFYSIASHPGRTVKLMNRLKHKNGDIIWAESTFTNLTADPTVNAIIINFRDVTERVVREQQMEDFIGIASHELKTPLTSLKAYTQVLEMRMKKENNTTSSILVSKIDKQIDRVVNMIFDLLDVTKLQSGILHLRKTHFDLNELIYEVVENLQNSSSTHKIRVTSDTSVTLQADRSRIGQVITNLLGNGIKYSPGADEVYISVRRDGPVAIVAVEDKGIGISQSEADKIFSRFYRVQSVKESFQGLGLGLYISSQIISRHGGNMGVKSEVNKGSVFWFSLPLESAGKSPVS